MTGTHRYTFDLQTKRIQMYLYVNERANPKAQQLVLDMLENALSIDRAVLVRKEQVD